MWTLALIAVLAIVLGQGTARHVAGPPGSNLAGPPGSNLAGDPGYNRVARSVNDLDPEPCPADCTTHEDTVHVMVHRPMGHPERPRTCCGDTIVHVHVDGRGKDIFHGNAVPGALNWAPGKMTFAKCEMVPGSRSELSGTIYMKQDLMGVGPVHAYFDLRGFEESDAHVEDHGHEHLFSVNWWGNTADACTATGGTFNLPKHDWKGKGRKGGRQPVKRAAHDHDHDHDDPNHDHDHDRIVKRAAHHDHHDHDHDDPNHDHDHERIVKRHAHDQGHSDEQGHTDKLPVGITEGTLGNLPCDDQGSMKLNKTLFSISLVGLHSVYGRSITIKTAGQPDSDPLACCVISYSSGTDFGYDDSMFKWLRTEMEDIADDEPTPAGANHHGHHDHH